MAELLKTEAIVLSAIRWRESSKIVHLYSRELGSVRIIAKGALRPKSPFRGVLETMNHIEVILSQKSTRSLQILTSASLTHSFLPIREDLEKTAVAFSILELLSSLFSMHEPVENFFDYLIVLLEQIERNNSGQNLPFLWHLLFRTSHVLGFSWNIETCLRCDEPVKSGPVAIDSANSGFRCGNCAGFSNASKQALSLDEWQSLQTFLNNAVPNSDRLPVFKADWLSYALLRQLSIHTDINLELKSLKWYM